MTSTTNTLILMITVLPSHLDVPPKTKKFILGFVLDDGKDTRPFLHRIVPIVVSLATSPFFILDPKNNLATLRASKDYITLKQLMNVSISDPPNLPCTLTNNVQISFAFEIRLSTPRTCWRWSV